MTCAPVSQGRQEIAAQKYESDTPNKTIAPPTTLLPPPSLGQGGDACLQVCALHVRVPHAAALRARVGEVGGEGQQLILDAALKGGRGRKVGKGEGGAGRGEGGGESGLGMERKKTSHGGGRFAVFRGEERGRV